MTADLDRAAPRAPLTQIREREGSCRHSAPEGRCDLQREASGKLGHRRLAECALCISVADEPRIINAGCPNRLPSRRTLNRTLTRSLRCRAARS